MKCNFRATASVNIFSNGNADGSNGIIIKIMVKRRLEKQGGQVNKCNLLLWFKMRLRCQAV